MSENITDINFDKKKAPLLNFDIVPIENILKDTYSNHDPTKLHRLNFYTIFIVTSGEGIHCIDFKDYKVTKGSILTIRKNQIHAFYQSNIRGNIIVFTEEFALNELEGPRSSVFANVFNELLFNQHTLLEPKILEQFELLLAQMKEEFTREKDANTSIILSHYVQIIIRKLFRVRSSTPNLIISHKHTSIFLAFQKLVITYCSQKRTVLFYADQLNLSTKTLNTICQNIIHITAKKFIDETATLQIKRLLLNTHLSIKEIAYQFGFEEPSNLFKFFKRQTKQTPEEFRSMHTKTN